MGRTVPLSMGFGDGPMPWRNRMFFHGITVLMSVKESSFSLRAMYAKMI